MTGYGDWAVTPNKRRTRERQSAVGHKLTAAAAPGTGVITVLVLPFKNVFKLPEQSLHRKQRTLRKQWELRETAIHYTSLASWSKVEARAQGLACVSLSNSLGSLTHPGDTGECGSMDSWVSQRWSYTLALPRWQATLVPEFSFPPLCNEVQLNLPVTQTPLTPNSHACHYCVTWSSIASFTICRKSWKLGYQRPGHSVAVPLGGDKARGLKV